MKISLNDKRVFIVLGLLGLAVIYYNFIYSSQQKTIKKYTKNIELYEENSQESDGLALRVAGIDTELKIFNEKLKNVRTMFPPDITQENVLVLLKKFSEETGFRINNISFSDLKEVSGNLPPPAPVAVVETETGSDSDKEVDVGDKVPSAQTVNEVTSVTITDKKFLDALDSFGIAYGQTDKSGDGKTNIPDGKGFSFGLDINGTSTNKQFKDFLYKLEDFRSAISIKSVQINGDNDEELSVNMEIEFFGIADKKAKEQGKFFDLEWSPLDPAGKSNIFTPYEGYVETDNMSNDTKKAENNYQNTEKQLTEYDFSMRVLPFGADVAPPTVTFVGKSIPANESSMPIVYGDSRNNENVDLYIEANDGKFYCKFKTDHEAFPEFTYNSLAEFKASGNDIKILIDSSKRTSTNDNSGVAFTVTNNTDKNLVIDVVNEDDNRPRVTIKKSGNNVIINYK